MNSIFGIILIVLLVVSGYSIGFGVNLKTGQGWLQVLSGFLLGLLMGQNLAERLIAGVFLAGWIILLGPIAWKRHQAAKELLNARGSSLSYLERLRRRHNCPRCGSLLPRFRIPNSVPQLLYGGTTCKQCGCEIDSTGHEITPT
jgi:hypothetical protein